MTLEVNRPTEMSEKIKFSSESILVFFTVSVVSLNLSSLAGNVNLITLIRFQILLS